MTAFECTDSTENITQRLDLLCDEYEQLFPEIQALESRINRFLDAYLQQVGPYFSPHKPGSALPSSPPHSHLAVNDNTTSPLDSPQHALKSSPEVKRLHRKLVKHFHPDARQRSHINHDIMAEIQEAYAAGSLIRLHQLYHDIMLQELHNEAEQMHLLQQWHDELEASVTALHAQYQTLRQSPEYRLMRKSESAEKEGIDLARQVIENRQKIMPELEE